MVEVMSLTSIKILRLLQLTSPSLPVGAYSYSEGLECLVDRGMITSATQLQDWIIAELRYGSARIDAAIGLRGYQAVVSSDCAGLLAWNAWLTANRESEELRLQSWQMGRSLLRLLRDLPVALPAWWPSDCFAQDGCHFAIAFGTIAALWEIDDRTMVLGYLYSWASNLITAGIKLIPLGQTAGQRLLLDLDPILTTVTEQVLGLNDHDLVSCGWGLSIASMAHEVQYSRLFRS
jgi:urease accessory protein